MECDEQSHEERKARAQAMAGIRYDQIDDDMKAAIYDLLVAKAVFQLAMVDGKRSAYISCQDNTELMGLLVRAFIQPNETGVLLRRAASIAQEVLLESFWADEKKRDGDIWDLWADGEEEETTRLGQDCSP